jgi:hypothetical protein
MDIIIKLKFLFSLLLACCLFLPLSQCSSSTPPKIGEPQQKVITKRYAFNSPSDIDSWLHLSTLVFPFLISVVSIKSKHKIKLSLLALVICFGALYTVVSATFLADRILIGGYLAYVSSLSLITLLSFEIWLNYKKRRQVKKS